MTGLDQLPMWIVTDHPDDHPDHYVARRHEWHGGEIRQYLPTTMAIMHRDLETLRAELQSMGLTCIPRELGDDPVVVETWL